MNANKILDAQERSVIQQRIAEIEQTTSAEIVCAVANESGRYDRAESVIGLLTGCAALGIAHLINSQLTHPGDWSASGISLFFQLLALIIGFVIGNYLASYVVALRRPFVVSSHLEDETKRAASLLFSNHVVGKTKSRCGILVYLSLFERRIVILSDQKCRDALGDEAIETICQSTLPLLRAKQHRQAIVHAIDQLAVKLVELLPADRTIDENELSDHVLVLHRP